MLIYLYKSASYFLWPTDIAEVTIGVFYQRLMSNDHLVY